MYYTKEEYRDILVTYLEVGRDAEQRYAQLYNNRKLPTFSTFYKIYQRFMKSGGVGAENHRQEKVIIDAVLDNPKESCRSLEKQHRISKCKVHPIIKRNGLYPYHYSPVQKVDHQRRFKCNIWAGMIDAKSLVHTYYQTL